jgi:methylated-DNA-[protein]-cysteine S-methyltransferase
MRVYELTMESPVGLLRLMADENGLTGVYLPSHKGEPPPVQAWEGAAPPVLLSAREQLDEYFAGKRTVFDLPLAPRGTEFQQEVWRALREIPYGETRSYGELAARVGRPGAARAVGAANGRNPVSIIVPCHRVVGASGALTGYAGGMERKQWLLRHEGS